MSGSSSRKRKAPESAIRPHSGELVRRVLDDVNLDNFEAMLGAPLADGGLALDPAAVKATTREVLRFLATKAVRGDVSGEKFSASARVDAAWHLLMLHPVLYRDVCSVLGGLLDHRPRGAAEEKAARSTALARSRRPRFGATLPRRTPSVSTFWAWVSTG